MKKTLIILVLFTANLFADFNFSECLGSGTFEQQIEAYGGNKEKAVKVGDIPKGIKGFHVELISDKDVDIRLYGANGDKIVHWPNGILNGKNKETKPYKGVNVTYSGFNGINGQYGHESIDIAAATPTGMTMKAFGYKAGYATVNYSWTGKEGCTPKKSGKGTFTQKIMKKAISLVGTIPPGIEDVNITLKSDKDLDIQLYAVDGTAIVAWPRGILKKSSKQTTTYHGMKIEWSGYNGTNGHSGHEYIKLTGKTTEMLVMKVYGYRAGKANVTYKWGIQQHGDFKITGKVLDLKRNPIPNATVKMGTRTTQTNNSGQYTFKNVSASERLMVDVSHPEYLRNSRITPMKDFDIILDIMLGKAKASKTFDATEGTVLKEDDNASVALPANGYIDANGKSYTGQVKAKMSYYPITTRDGRAVFPGTFEGISQNKSFSIQSYGFMNVELTDTEGNRLNLANSSTATLTFPKDTSINGSDTIPLWYYDEVKGYWKQEGEAHLEDGQYVGTVHHFTSWNLDTKIERSSLKGCVVDKDGGRVAYAQVFLSSDNWDNTVLYTDAKGDFIQNIPLKTHLSASAMAPTVDGKGYVGSYPKSIYAKDTNLQTMDSCIVLDTLQSDRYSKDIFIKGRLYTWAFQKPRPHTKLPYSVSFSEYYKENYIAYGDESDKNGYFNFKLHQVPTRIYIFGVKANSDCRLKYIQLDPHINTYNIGHVAIGFCS